MRERLRIRVRGIVQGIGFRPFVYRLATRFSLGGWVKNDAEGVLIELEGEIALIEAFLDCLQRELPSAGEIIHISRRKIKIRDEFEFSIKKSDEKSHPTALISPDLAICEKCKNEIADIKNRRYKYAFTNCTECGPRYSIIKSAPYDRIRTSMFNFIMCSRCRREYEKVDDRRFHAQPNACFECGPTVTLFDSSNHVIEGDWIEKTRAFIKEGKIVAIKGIGGYHFAVDATNELAVRRLRTLKKRPQKPLAVMVGGIEKAKKIAYISAKEEEILTSKVSPIVILRRTQETCIAPSVAIQNNYLGIMLPYTPLHAVLLSPEDVWVMTSANTSGEPQIADDYEVKKLLSDVADVFLVHNREIINPIEDSVVFVENEEMHVLRRGRGLAPMPFRIAHEKSILALGAEKKSSFCYTKKGEAYLSEYIGDLKSKRTFSQLHQKLERYQKLFSFPLRTIAVDLHPAYYSTQVGERLSEDKKKRLIRIQHHHAHIASVLAEHGEKGPVLGVAFDGAGYGDDGNIWGGEFFLATLKNYRRLAHLSYRPLPGGDKASVEIWRLGLGVLYGAFNGKIEREDYKGYQQKGGELVIKAALEGINSPLTSSAGRLFDAVAATLGVCYENTYEGEAASYLEQLALKGKKEEVFFYDIVTEKGMIQIDFLPMLFEIARRYETEDTADLARSFHVTLADMIKKVIDRLSISTKCRKVALSGGVFQNRFLLQLVKKELSEYEVLVNKQIPTNDGGIAYGQVAVAGAILERR